MRAAIIHSGVVVNVIEVERIDDVACCVPAQDCGDISDKWDGEKFIKPDPPQTSADI